MPGGLSSAARVLRRPPQRAAPFLPGDPSSGYYNDLTIVLGAVAPHEVEARLDALVADRRLANHVTVAQHALGAWQLRDRSPRWLDVFRRGAEWLRAQLEPDGGLQYRFDMPHTYEISAPWTSSMAQGEAASVFVRAALLDDAGGFGEAARRAVRPLLDPASPLVVATEEGPVLQEYPTTPASHVLNGWIFALWGLHDVGADDAAAAKAFSRGVETLARRVGLYEVGGGWSRYDLYPHRLKHVASPFYHRLHVSLLEATAKLSGDDRLGAVAHRWAAAEKRPATVGMAVARKVAFRVAVPRRRAG